MKIGIIGGGLTGLVAGHVLAQDHEVYLYEKMPVLGGCLSSYHVQDYWIERYYHHCFSGDLHLFSLLEELGLTGSLEWRKGTTGYYREKKIYPLNTPLEILKYPGLSLPDKARLAWLTFTARKANLAKLDDIPGRTVYSGASRPECLFFIF